MLTLKLAKEFWIIVGAFIEYAYGQDIIFVNEGVDTGRISIHVSSPNHIPEDILISLNNVENVTDFLNRFVQSNENGSTDPIIIAGRRNSATAAALISPGAECQTEDYIVELEKPADPLEMLYPSCVRVKRCRGCCSSPMLTCQPTDTSVKNVTVLKVKYSGATRPFEHQGTRTFSLEQHERCSCSCKEKPEHCTQNVHEYDQSKCKCVCTNQEEAARCTGSKKEWSTKECQCKCKKVRRCSTGLLFSPSKCRCETPTP